MLPVLLTGKARKNIGKFSAETKNRCAAALRVLSSDPFRGEALLGEFRGLRRYRVGDLRIIYRLEKKPGGILVVAVEHRREIYR